MHIIKCVSDFILRLFHGYLELNFYLWCYILRRYYMNLIF